MSLNLNKAIIAGRLVASPELKQTPNGIYVTSFTVAVNRPTIKGEESKADFINVVAWRQTAEFVCKHFEKGAALCIAGSIQTRSWQDQSGAKRYATEVIADEVRFVESKNSVQTAAAYDDGAQMTEISQDDELPF